MSPAFEECPIFGTLTQLADEWRDVFEEVPIGDDPDASAVIAVDDEVVVVGLLEDGADVVYGIVHRDGLDGVGHDIVDDEGVHGIWIGVWLRTLHWGMSDNKTGGEGVGFGPAAIWAPWRLAYIESLSEGEGSSGKKAPPPDAGGSFLRDYWKHPELDAAHHVIERTSDGLIMLNKYPYANGHLLVALGEARPTLLDYEPDQRAALWALVDRAAALVTRALEPQGMNIGINQGRAGGAGVPSHLHVHVIPRWGGDTNFITAVGGIRVMPSSLEAMYERYMRASDGSN